MCELVETFRHRLRDIMDARGWTQKQLAEELGVSPPTVSELLGVIKPRGQKVSGPHLARVQEVADALGVEAASLLAPYSSKKKRLQAQK